ncbi:ATP-dependent Clp protease ATP-binding subunit [bacterium]|nr:ATP-dependent Clp protease ATP-binding subunit [bacterium]
MFDFKKTKFYNGLLVEPLFKVIKPLKWISFAIVSVSIAIYIFYEFALTSNNNFIPIIYLFFVILIISLCFDSFYENSIKSNVSNKKLSELQISEDSNLAQYFSYESMQYLYKTFSLGSDGSYISATKLLYNLLDKKNQKTNFIFSRLLFDLETLKNIFHDFSRVNENLVDCNLIALSALGSAIKREGVSINEGDIICALADIEPNFKKILTDFQIKRSDLENLNWWIEYISKKNDSIKKFWEYNNLIRTGSVGGDWACGWSPTLDQYSIDWTNTVRTMGYEESIGHNEQVSIIEDSLTKRGNKNVLVVGEIGSGRKSVIYQVIRKSIYDKSLPEINGKKFIQLDLISLVSTIESGEKVEATLDMCFKEAIHAGNIVLIIDDLQEFLGGSKTGIVDISGILIPYLNNPNLQLICITTYNGLHSQIEAKPAILQSLVKVEIPELTPEETLLILQGKVFSFEKQYNKFISYQSLIEIIKTSQKYIATPFPQKAIDLLEESFAYSDTKGISDIIEPEDVDFVITKKTDIPIGSVNSQEKVLLLSMEQELHKRVISQDDAIKEISAALRRARSGVQTRKGPMGTFLFLGPTGVGKTETAKAVAEVYFGSEDKMIRIDMSEFQRTEDIPRLMGSESQPGILTTKVRESPFSLVLLDELEKAHPDVLNLFLQVLDEGYLNDNFGQKVSFINTIIIATSNAGYQIILDSIKEKKPIEEIKDLLLDNIFQKGIFRPEFVNRFDGLVVFKPLTHNDLIQIAHIQLMKLRNKLLEKEINFVITDELKRKIVDLSYDPIFGAREMKRVIQEKVEDCLAKEFLADTIKNGATIAINPNSFTVSINNPE